MSNQSPFPWPKVRAARLATLIAQGLSNSEIAYRMGLTKNQVVGRIAREYGSKPNLSIQGKFPVVPWSYPPRGGCHWPEGDPKKEGFSFCGRVPTIPGRPYCAEHERRAYNPKLAKDHA